jgi:16S rRNA processing protein RimM
MAMARSPQRLILLGRVLAPFGVKGWVKVEPFAESARNLRAYPEWRVGRGEPDAAWGTVTVAESAEHSGNVVARFDGCHDRDAALRYRGMGVAVARSALPPAAPGEFYQADLVGLRVVNEQGEELGRIAGLFSNGAHEVMRVQRGGGEQLLPFVAAVVRGVDVAAGFVRVDWQSDW